MAPDKSKEAAMAKLWLENAANHPERRLFEDIPVEYRINAYIQGAMTLEKDWTALVLSHLYCVSSALTVSGAKATFTFEVQPAHCNGLLILHGGCAATLFDLTTTLPLALLGKPGLWELLGVSRNLDVTYLRPVPLGTTVFLECEVVQATKNMAAARGVMRIGSKDGPISCLAAHDKFNTDPPVNSKM